MTKYFSQDTPLAGLERMMMSVPGFQKRGGGMMVLCRFHYKKEDVDCTYCRSYMRHTCQESVCPYIPERLEAGTIGYQELAERCLRMAGHQKLWKRASSLSKGNTLPLALEPAHRHRLSEWPEAGTASICPQKLAAVYLLSSRIGLWRRVLPHISHGRIDFSSVSLRGIDPRDYPVYRAAKGLYCGKLLITSAELADEEQVSSEAFGDILNAMLIARYGKTIIGQAIDKGGANSEKECGFQCVECLIPSLREMINDAIADAGGLAPAEKMATLLKQKQRIWNEDAIIKYKAILEASGCSGLQDAIRLMEDLDQYELRPDVAQPWGYAELVLREKYPDLPEALFQTGQSAEIGRELLEDRNGVITEYGLIRRLDGQPVQSLHEAPEQNGMEMI